MDVLEIAKRWNDSIATTPEQAWSEVAAMLPESVTREELLMLMRLVWKLASTVEGRIETHAERTKTAQIQG